MISFRPFAALMRAAIALCLSLFATAAAAAAENNRALLIANADYLYLADLEAALTDKQKLSKLLRSNFSVQALEDQNSTQFKSAWRAFLNRQTTGGVALFYFTGHGVQIGDDNYLLPRDLPKNPGETRIRQQGAKLQQLFTEFRAKQEQLRKQGETLHGVFIIDACRTHFDQKKQQQSAGVLRPENTGEPSPAGGAAVQRAASMARVAKPQSVFENKASVQPIAPPPGLFVMYAASAGQVAHTRLKDETNMASVYTRVLLKLLGQKHSVQRSAQKVRWQVYRQVAEHKPTQLQTPRYFDLLHEEIHLLGIPNEDADHDNDEASLGVRVSPEDSGRDIWECEFCPVMSTIPAGEVTVGPPPSATAAENNENTTLRPTVKIEKPFLMGQTEVTRAEYRAFLTNNGDKDKLCPKGHVACNPNGEEKPITGVTWDEATAYINWLNKKLDLSPGKPEKGYYRLPTEAEWEYAARGESNARFVFGDDANELCAYGNIADFSLKTLWISENCDDGAARGVTHSRRYKPNEFGLYDVHGNAWEWVQDCWTDKMITAKAKETAKKNCRRVARGGSWRSTAAAASLSSRTAFSHSHQRPTVSFRVMRVLGTGEIKKASEDE